MLLQLCSLDDDDVVCCTISHTWDSLNLSLLLLTVVQIYQEPCNSIPKQLSSLPCSCAQYFTSSRRLHCSIAWGEREIQLLNIISWKSEIACLQLFNRFSRPIAWTKKYRNFRGRIHGTQTRYVYLSRSSSKVFLLDDSWTQAVGFGQGVARSFLVVISITTPSAGKASFYGGPCGNLPFYPTTGERYLSL